MMRIYQKDGLTNELAAARVCQDIVLKAIEKGSLNKNVTIKGGVVMRNLTNNNRRATRDIDLDFIHYSIDDAMIRNFIKKLDCIHGIKLELVGEIGELKHQDYHGKTIKVRITDEEGTFIESKIDIGVHKDLELEQEEYCFDVCMDDTGVTLLKNSKEQMFAEKLRALLIFGVNDRRYKDIYDIYYLMGYMDTEKLSQYLRRLIFDDVRMREKTMEDIIKRVESSLQDESYLKRISMSRQRWIDVKIEDIASEIVDFLKRI